MNRADHNPISLSERIAKLERQNGWMRCGLLGTLVIISLVFLVGAQQSKSSPKNMETEQIIIRDQNGKKRIVLGIDDEYKARGVSPGLLLLDANEKQMIRVMAHDDGGAEIVILQDGQTRLELSTGTTTHKRIAALQISAEAGKHQQGQIGLGYLGEGKPFLNFNDHNNMTRAGIMLETGGRPILSLQDEQGRLVFSQAQPK